MATSPYVVLREILSREGEAVDCHLHHWAKLVELLLVKCATGDYGWVTDFLGVGRLCLDQT